MHGRRVWHPASFVDCSGSRTGTDVCSRARPRYHPPMDTCTIVFRTVVMLNESSCSTVPRAPAGVWQTSRHLRFQRLCCGFAVALQALRLVQAFQYNETHGEVCPAGWTPGGDSATIVPTVDGAKSYFASGATATAAAPPSKKLRS